MGVTYRKLRLMGYEAWWGSFILFSFGLLCSHTSISRSLFDCWRNDERRKKGDVGSAWLVTSGRGRHQEIRYIIKGRLHKPMILTIGCYIIDQKREKKKNNQTWRKKRARGESLLWSNISCGCVWGCNFDPIDKFLDFLPYSWNSTSIDWGLLEILKPNCFLIGVKTIVFLSLQLV